MEKYIYKFLCVLLLSITLSFILSERGLACESGWIYRQHQVCPDPIDPIFNLGSSAEICGSFVTTEPHRDHLYQACRKPANGLERYEEFKRIVSPTETTFSLTMNLCLHRSAQRRAAENLPADYRWTVLPAIFVAKVRVPRRRNLVNLKCHYLAERPIYHLRRVPDCGQEPWVDRPTTKAKSCRAPQFGVEKLIEKMGPHCPLESNYRVATSFPDELDIEYQITDVECLTCDNLTVDSKLQVNRKLACLLKNLQNLKASNGSLNNYESIRKELDLLLQEYNEWALPRFKQRLGASHLLSNK